jgi:hypothetical protein
LNDDKKLFFNLFSEYKAIYDDKGYSKNDFTSERIFRENVGDNLVKQHKFFECNIFRLYPSISSEKSS